LDADSGEAPRMADDRRTARARSRTRGAMRTSSGDGVRTARRGRSSWGAAWMTSTNSGESPRMVERTATVMMDELRRGRPRHRGSTMKGESLSLCTARSKPTYRVA
jgi:hypothetical protein